MSHRISGRQGKNLAYGFIRNSPLVPNFGLRFNPLVWYAGLYAGTTALLKLVGFALFMWLAYALPVKDYAAFGLFYALQTALTSLALAGIFEAVVGLLQKHQTPVRRRRLLGAANTAFALMALPAIAFVLFVFFAFARASESGLQGLIYVLASGILIAYSSLQAQIIRLEEQHLSSLHFSFLSPLAGLIGGGGAFLFEKTVQSFFLGSAIGLSLSMLGLCVCRIGFYEFVSRINVVRPILLRVAPFIAIAFLGWLSGYGNNYFVKVLFNSEEVAKFTFVFTLSSILQLIASSLNQVWSPRFYRIVYERPLEEVEKKNRLFFRSQGLALGLAGGIVIAIYPATIGVLGGKLIAYQAMNVELLLLFASYVLLSPWWHCQNYYLVHGKGQQLMKIVLVTSVVGVVTWLMLMWLLGPIGIYIGFMAQMLLRTSAIVAFAKKHWSVTIAWEGVALGLLLTLGGFVISTVTIRQ